VVQASAEDESSNADVRLVDVSKAFGGIEAVRGVSLAVRRGEFFSLLGPSGCGKTTTLRMIAGFEAPTSGELYLRGKLINKVPPHRRATNMVFQQLALFPHLSVFENVAFGLRLRRLSGAELGPRVTDALALVSLQGFEHRSIGQLSGGQQQRVAIARALVNEPAVLLLDEPLGALDLKLRAQMQLELKALQARLGTTFIYVTHDQGEALTMSDRVAIMNGGCVEQVGTPREVYERPITKFVATFVGDTSLIAGQVVGREDGEVVVEARGIRIRARTSIRGDSDQVFLSVRPEYVLLGPAAARLPSHLIGTIRSAVFQGTLVRFTVEVPGAVVVLADVLNGSDAASLKVGDQVAVGWLPERVIVLSS
jgi:spermidine/putrescine transport system ATP-binding protein